MPLPSLLLALLFALLYGALYHLLRGGGFWRLCFYLVLSVIGFGTGYLIGLWRGWVLILVGALDLGLSSVGSFLFLLLGDLIAYLGERYESKV